MVADGHGSEQETTPAGPVAEPPTEPCELALDFEREDEAQVETGGPPRPEDDQGSAKDPAPKDDDLNDVREGENEPPTDAEPGEIDGFRI